MPERHGAASRSGVVSSALAGAVLGAAGLAWFLLSEAENRRIRARQQRALRLSRFQESGGSVEAFSSSPGHQADSERELHDKVHQLNEAIDDVRRQLEAMSTSR